MTGVRIMITAVIAACGLAGAAAAQNFTSQMQATGDFDGDGLTDTAQMVSNDRGYHVTVTRGAAPRDPAVIAEGPAERAPNTMNVVPPGEFRTTAAGPGEGRSEQIRTRGQALIYGTAESSSALVYWTGDEFRTVWLAD